MNTTSIFRRAFAAFGLAIMVLITGCATNTMTGRMQVTLGSEQDLIVESAQGFAAMKSQYAAKRELVTHAPTIKRINAITNRLIDQAVKYRPDSAAWDWEVMVVNTPELNAWALPGGKMAIFTGMINLPLTDDEIAQIMGHEIGHALAKHGLEKKSTRQGAAVLTSIGGALLGQTGMPLSQEAVALGASGFIVAPNSRKAESEADAMGIEFAARAGYDPKAAVTLWQKMAAKGGATKTGFLDTHPSDGERIQALSGLHDHMKQLRAESAPMVAGKGKARPTVALDAKNRPEPFNWLGAPKAMRPDIKVQAPLQLFKAQ
ncbi:M48 family metallopeptidase [Hydrogenophaga sp. 2FB]|uniref:M48 family metallopeptidase n=1 Tax=Hydrogenophaga sp. 2FB TaxID=2502187 RepID=UPI001BB15A5F|nr:M48 family metallopeptidase [Hydrogenophaga sp. 2FB]